MIRVLVKASSPVVQAGLEQMILSEPDLQVVHETNGRGGGRKGTDEEPPDVIVAETEEADEDPAWPDTMSLNGPDAALLLLADDPASFSGLEALQSGAKGVLPARVSQEELVAAIRGAAAGLIVLHPEAVLHALPGRPAGGSRRMPLIEPLTAREKEVLSILAEGGTNKQIASRLSISEHTAKFHVSSVMSKLGATSRTEAVTMAIRQGVIMV